MLRMICVAVWCTLLLVMLCGGSLPGRASHTASETLLVSVLNVVCVCVLTPCVVGLLTLICFEAVWGVASC
jgi:hypothetical protein